MEVHHKKRGNMDAKVLLATQAAILQAASTGKSTAEISKIVGLKNRTAVKNRLRTIYKTPGILPREMSQEAGEDSENKLAMCVDWAIRQGEIEGPPVPQREISKEDLEFIQCLRQGLTNNQITSLLPDSRAGTVRYRLRVLFERYGAKSRAHLVALATVQELNK